ncbi:DUF2848 family protein [Roseomonas sp. BN140053]|uniref:DUF2848 family protein n=1 Tax=Roseomonas sp. BN140053 TaxID=3391898 RepID=UPI0039E9F724
MQIDVTVMSEAGPRQASFPVRRMYNLGSATRESGSAVAHQEEVAKEGVFVALDVPAPRIYPIGHHALITGEEVFVHCPRTSGEVEIVIHVADQVYVGVGSDHTDRELEKSSIPWSKQACVNVLAPVLWPLAEMRDRWDSCVLRSWVDGRAYQDVGVKIFLHPDDVLRILRERVAELPERDFTVFCGTFVSLSKELGYGKRWEFELEDPAGNRRIRHGYDVLDLFGEIRPEYRVPLHNAARG